MLLHWENVKGKGYRVVQPSEHGTCALNHIKRAGRRVKRSARIVSATRMEHLDADQQKRMTDLQVRVGILSQQMAETRREVRKLSAAIEYKPLNPPRFAEIAAAEAELKQ